LKAHLLCWGLTAQAPPLSGIGQRYHPPVRALTGFGRTLRDRLIRPVWQGRDRVLPVLAAPVGVGDAGRTRTCIVGLGNRCSIQLNYGASVCWERGWDLNPRPSGYEPDELPDCSTQLQQQYVCGQDWVPAVGLQLLAQSRRSTWAILMDSVPDWPVVIVFVAARD
jgi:hypothetical protein